MSFNNGMVSYGPSVLNYGWGQFQITVMVGDGNAEKKVFFRFELSKWLVDDIKYILKLNSEKILKKFSPLEGVVFPIFFFTKLATRCQLSNP